MAVPTVICMKVTNSQQNHVCIPCTGIYRNGNNLESVDRNLFIPPNKIFVNKLEDKRPLGHLGVDESIILKLI